VLPPPNNAPDKYDVNGPSSGVSNGPGSRAKNFQLTQNYNIIVWDSGDLQSITISDGTVNSDKSNDCRMLIDWFENSEHVCGLWVCGDDVAYDLDGLASTPALTLMSTWCGVDFVATSYFHETGGRTGGGIVTPLITGDTDAGVFVHSGVPDQFYAFGGCPIINQFDVLEKTANGKYALSYPPYNATNRYAAIASSQLNAGAFNVNTLWFGFSFQYIRDDDGLAPLDRNRIAKDAFNWMQHIVNPEIVAAETPKFTKLAQNYPNPFNPSTTIPYSIGASGSGQPATISFYNVTGMMIDRYSLGAKQAGEYTFRWNPSLTSRNGVPSGVYYCRLQVGKEIYTRKVILLR
jgi:hypothetical protein